MKPRIPIETDHGGWDGRLAWPERWTSIGFALVTAVLLGRAFVLVHNHVVELLFWDQWEIDAPLFRGESILDQFRWQQGPHLLGVGLVWSAFLARWTAWSCRAESYSIVVFLGTSLLAGVLLKWRRIGCLSWWDLLLPLLFLSGTLRDVYLEGITPAQSVLPLLLLMLHGHGLLLRNRWTRAVSVSISTFLLQFTGYGFFAGALTILLHAVEAMRAWLDGDRRKLTAAVVTVLAAAGSFGSFLLVFRFEPALDCFQFPHERPWEYPMFAALMLANFAFLKWRILGWVALFIGGLVLATLILCLASSWIESRKDTDRAVEVYFMTFTLMFVFATAIGRVCLGFDLAQTSRYMPPLIPGFLGLYFWLCTRRPSPWRTAGLAAIILYALPGAIYPWQLGDAYPNADKFRLRERWRECYVETNSIRECDARTGISIYPVNDAATEQMLKQRLDYLRDRHLNLFRDPA